MATGVRVASTAKLFGGIATNAELPVRATLVSVEVHVATSGSTFASQVAVEVFNTAVPANRVSQVAVEVFYPTIIPARITQDAVEWYQGRLSAAVATQVAVEVFLKPYPPSCPVDFWPGADTSEQDCRSAFPIDTDLFPL